MQDCPFHRFWLKGSNFKSLKFTNKLDFCPQIGNDAVEETPVLHKSEVKQKHLPQNVIPNVCCLMERKIQTQLSLLIPTSTFISPEDSNQPE